MMLEMIEAAFCLHEKPQNLVRLSLYVSTVYCLPQCLQVASDSLDDLYVFISKSQFTDSCWIANKKSTKKGGLPAPLQRP
jgi:hypothetical protein